MYFYNQYIRFSTHSMFAQTFMDVIGILSIEHQSLNMIYMTSYNMKRKGRIIPRDRELQYIVYLKSLFFNYEYEFIYHYTKVYQRKEENFDKWVIQAYSSAIDFIGHQDSNSGYKPWKVHPHTILFCIHRQSYPPKDDFEEQLKESCLYLYQITQWIIELVPRYIRPKSRYPFPLDRQKLTKLKESLLLIDKVVIQLSPEVVQNKEGGGKITYFYNQKFQVNEDEYINKIKKPIIQFMKIQKRDDNFLYTDDKIKCALFVFQDQLKRPEFRDQVLNYYSLQGLQFIVRKVMIKFVQKENAKIINQFRIQSIHNPIEVTARFEKIINLLTSRDGQQFYYCLKFLVLFIYDMMDEVREQQYIHPDKWVFLMSYLYHESLK
ncbi:hypothetical protein pb186bvf_011381 [Paramecium bursaria]